MTGKQIVMKFSDEIEDSTIEEIKSEIEVWILDDYYDLELKDGVFIRRFLCDWCDDDITRDEAANKDGKCAECYLESTEDDR